MVHSDTCVGPRRRAHLRAATLFIATLCLASASSAWAAKVYRCGNTFQDQPCAETKPVETRPAERPAVTRQVVADCGANAKDSGARECASVKIARDTPQGSAATDKQ